MIKSVVVETEEGRKVEVVGENAFLRSCLEVMLEDYPDSFKDAEKPDYGAEYAEIQRSRDAAMENQRTLSKANRMLMNENEGLKKRIEELETVIRPMMDVWNDFYVNDDSVCTDIETLDDKEFFNRLQTLFEKHREFKRAAHKALNVEEENVK